MELSAPIRPLSPKSKRTLPVAPSSEPAPSVLSPELLQTIQALKEEIAELRTKQGMTADENAELAQLKVDLAEAKQELKASKPSPGAGSTGSKRVVHYGSFATIEE